MIVNNLECWTESTCDVVVFSLCGENYHNSALFQHGGFVRTYCQQRWRKTWEQRRSETSLATCARPNWNEGLDTGPSGSGLACQQTRCRENATVTTTYLVGYAIPQTHVVVWAARVVSPQTLAGARNSASRLVSIQETDEHTVSDDD